MANWCKGSLKVRGKMTDIARWVRENVVAYTHKWENGQLKSIPNPEAGW